MRVGKLNHLGLSQSPAKSTACDGLRNRTDKFFEDVYFVTRQKPNAVYTLIKTVRQSEPKKDKAMVTLEEFIDLEYKLEDDEGKRLKGPKEVVTLRRICYQDEKSRKYEFLTNNLQLSAEEVAIGLMPSNDQLEYLCQYLPSSSINAIPMGHR